MMMKSGFPICFVFVAFLQLPICHSTAHFRNHALQPMISMFGGTSESNCKICRNELNKNFVHQFELMCKKAQEDICRELENIDGGEKFKTDEWVRESGGGGRTKVLSNGHVFEKAGVAVSLVYGKMSKAALRVAKGNVNDPNEDPNGLIEFAACGISSVIHPKNPFCPTLHFNFRYFQTENGVWWFGGGADITPCYLDESDIKHFHKTLKDCCDKYDPTYYSKFKKWADNYFIITHRNETRGLGGIFYDDLNDKDPHVLLSFAESGLKSIIPAYAPIIKKHLNDKYTELEKQWQQLRRGRYVEFNLIYDRGTIFGLKTGGRVESILMSLPETARWDYGHLPIAGSREHEITKLFKHPREWIDE